MSNVNCSLLLLQAARLKIENGEDIDFEVEKDEGYNADDSEYSGLFSYTTIVKKLN